MIDWKHWLCGAALAALFAAGCGGNVVVDGVGAGGGGVDPVVQDCITICNDYQDCTTPVDSCEDTCNQAKSLWDASGCTAEAATFYECFANVPNKCEDIEQCIDEAVAFSDCFTPYCNANPDACAGD